MLGGKGLLGGKVGGRERPSERETREENPLCRGKPSMQRETLFVDRYQF